MALAGADLLFYPTAIGSEPQDPTIDSAAHWQRVMQGHAGANMVPVIASNRIGTEAGRKGTSLTFYGSSFIADHRREGPPRRTATETVLTHRFDLDAIAASRAAWGLFRDRRPELYRPLISLDGTGRA